MATMAMKVFGLQLSMVTAVSSVVVAGVAMAVEVAGEVAEAAGEVAEAAGEVAEAAGEVAEAAVAVVEIVGVELQTHLSVKHETDREPSIFLETNKTTKKINYNFILGNSTEIRLKLSSEIKVDLDGVSKS
jgi:hypothetical protein